MVDADHLHRCAEFCLDFLSDHVDGDWSAAIPDLTMSVVDVVAHMAEGCLWYAIDFSADGADLSPVEHRVKADAAPADVVATLRAYTKVVTAVIRTSAPEARGYHPMGAADASGFAAMTCDEMLIHSDDAARGLGVDFDPGEALAKPVLRRLFPWVTDVVDPWEQLRWANGRVGYGPLPRLEGWVWHCRPLQDWDGHIPVHPNAS